ncbi:probable RNA methyltransferase CG11342 [Plodia interpunctella]|uniref:probable RNA methyltransferase CG11342 n=1 Tax=Plodia interpunctella TaxID=58824 RepID=UPI002368EBF1|nr:probable RNA methyltransferase CG11342 [Plodia interpunctella]
MNIEELKFIGYDPGAAKFGNFINYYSFHSVEQRINNLNPQMFPHPIPNQDIFCLDIGCNTGDLTKKLYLYLEKVYPESNIKILAVDIDSTLIKRAQETSNNTNISYQTADIMEDNDLNLINNYLSSFGRKEFDIVFCFSVTMWIHINNGDKGLLTLLDFLKSVSRSIIVEAQPWNCYRNAQRRMKKSGSNFPYYEKLTIRNNVDFIIEQKLSENTHNKIYESPYSKWNRKVQSFHKV